MRIKRRTAITVEAHEIWVIRRRHGRARAWCAQCQDAPLITPEEAAVLARTSARTIYCWVEAGLLHYVETTGGRLLVCLDSLPAPAPVK